MAIHRVAALFFQEDVVLSRQIKELTNDLTADILMIERIGSKIPLNLPASLARNFFDKLTLSIVKNIDKLVAYLEIAKAQNGEMIRPINFNVLIKEYQRLNLEMFFQPRTIHQIVRDFQPSGVREITDRIYNVPEDEKKSRLPIKKLDNSKPARNLILKQELSSRQEKILDVIKKNHKARMSDFLDIFRNEVTERTLRNDLKGLVGVGAVRAEGEFKTRRYYLK
ncbi:hypothetical protein HY798_05280 [Candidatus Falkowbacteria bacterium]|nr:hypothetical protein [Candidatus Falkowbacteria bacterium]